MLHSLLLLHLLSVQRASAEQQEGGLGPGPHLRPQVELESEVCNHGLGPQVPDVEEQEQAGLQLPQRGGHIPPLLPPTSLNLTQELELSRGLCEISQCPET